jgi:hypothetical protein
MLPAVRQKGANARSRLASFSASLRLCVRFFVAFLDHSPLGGSDSVYRTSRQRRGVRLGLSGSDCMAASLSLRPAAPTRRSYVAEPGPFGPSGSDCMAASVSHPRGVPTHQRQFAKPHHLGPSGSDLAAALQRGINCCHSSFWRAWQKRGDPHPRARLTRAGGYPFTNQFHETVQ